MKKIQKTAIIYLVIFVQSALAIIAGAFAIHSFSERKLPPGMIVGIVDVGNVDRQEAESLINKYYGDIFEKGKLQIEIKDGSTFSIPYVDFEAGVDSKATLDAALGTGSSSVLDTFKKEFNKNSEIVKPVINLNESKLRKILIEWSDKIDKAPVDAVLYYQSGKIIKKLEQDGQKLNIKNAVEKIRNHISSDPSATLAFIRYDNYELEIVQSQRKLRDLAEVDTIIAEYATKLIYPEFTDALKRAAEAVNGYIMPVLDGKNSETAEFSFVEWLKSRDKSFENDNEGYDQVASTLYAAVLSAGIDKSSITRLAHEIPVDYIEPGLDAWISGNGGEFKFSNTLKHKLAILANIEDNQLIIRIAGNSADKKQIAVELKVDIVERFLPPVLNVENKNLKKGEKIVLDQGKEGIKVNVYRDTELVSKDKYEAVKKVVQIGPDTEWSNSEADK